MLSPFFVAYTVMVVWALPVNLSSQSTLPSSLLFRQSEAMGNQVELSLQSDTKALVLRCKQWFQKGDREEVLRPSASQWRHFRSQLDQLRVRDWARECPNSAKVMDGTQWVLEIQYPDRSLLASGDNCFPGEDGQPVAQPSPTQPFAQLVQAMADLAGQPLSP